MTKKWIRLSLAAALLSVAGNILALSIDSIYKKLTPAFYPQALAQDIANLAVVAPLWLITAILALKGSWRAYFVWLGVLAFTVYNYFIYTFSIPFGPLFLLWIAVWGLSLFSLIGGVISIDRESIKLFFRRRAADVFSAWILIITAFLFGFLWLSEDIPALLSGTTPQSLVDLAIPTNPVHILDIGFFIPAVIMTGVMLLRRKALAYPLAPAFIVFLIMTGIPVLLIPLIQTARGEFAEWGAAVPIGTLTVLLTGMLLWLLSSVRAPKEQD